MNNEIDKVELTKAFVKNAFQENPHYSFNHWSVMYDHSVKAQELALEIAREVECNRTIVSIGALLHDIGKTYKADPETLHKNHESFNLAVSENFLDNLGLEADELRRIKDIILYQGDSLELKVIKDADALAMYSDKKLYMLWIKWALENGLDSEIKRKIDKFDRLNFEISRRLGGVSLKEMKKDWEEYQRSLNSAP